MIKRWFCSINQEKAAIVIMLIALLLPLYEMMILFPAMEADEENKRQELSRLEARLAEVKQFQDAHSQPELYIKELSDKEQRLLLQVPEKINTSKFLAELQKLAVIKGVTLGVVRPAREERSGGFSNALISVTLRGGYFQLMDFIKAVEHGSMSVYIDSLSILSQGDKLECGIGLRIFSQG